MEQYTHPERIGFGIRLGAIIIDIILISALSFFFGMFGLGAGGLAGAITSGGEGSAALAGGIAGFVATTVMVTALYNIIEGLVGASPGKMVLGIKIKRQDGTPGDTALYMKRWAIKNISSLLNLLAMFTGIGFISSIAGAAGFAIFVGCFLALRENKLALHDELAKTAVYRK